VWRIRVDPFFLLVDLDFITWILILIPVLYKLGFRMLLNLVGLYCSLLGTGTVKFRIRIGMKIKSDSELKIPGSAILLRQNTNAAQSMPKLKFYRIFYMEPLPFCWMQPLATGRLFSDSLNWFICFWLLAVKSGSAWLSRSRSRSFFNRSDDILMPCVVFF